MGSAALGGFCPCACVQELFEPRQAVRHTADGGLGGALVRYGQTRVSAGFRFRMGSEAPPRLGSNSRGQRRSMKGPLASRRRYLSDVVMESVRPTGSGRARNVLSQHVLRGSNRPIQYYYEPGDHLGSGAYGSVCRWRLRDRGDDSCKSCPAGGSSTMQSFIPFLSRGSSAPTPTPAQQVSLVEESPGPRRRSSPSDGPELYSSPAGQSCSSSDAGGSTPAFTNVGTTGTTAQQHVAVKNLPWQKISGGWLSCFRDKEQEEIIRAELEVLIRLDNPYIIKFKEWFEDTREGIYFVMELCEGSSFNVFLDDICKQSGSIRMRNMPYCQRFFRQVVYGVSYLHSLTPPIVHRDLKPDNILLTRHDPCSSTCNVKIIDFGLTRKAREPVSYTGKMGKMSGTPLFMAPECVLAKRYCGDLEKYEYTPEMDVWALGIIFGWIVTSIEHGAQYHLMLDKDSGEGFDVDLVDLGFAFHDRQPWNRELLMGSSPATFEVADRVLVYLPEVTSYYDCEGSTRATAGELLNMPWVTAGELNLSNLTMQIVTDQIRTYHQLEQFDRLLLSLVAEHADCHRAQVLKRTFRALDRENTGRLTKENLLEGLRRTDLTLGEDEVDGLFKALDRQEAEGMDYHEWMAVTIGRHMLQQDASIAKAFSCLDFSNEGKIVASNLSHVIGEAEAARLMGAREFITFEDFRSMVYQISEQRALILTGDAPQAPTHENDEAEVTSNWSVFSIPSYRSSYRARSSRLPSESESPSKMSWRSSLSQKLSGAS